MIGVFDSGIGGLSVVEHIKRKNPKTRIIYYGDLARVPYGDRSPKEIRNLFEEGTKFLLDRGVEEIIIACNTVIAVTGEGVEMVRLGLKKASEVTKNGRVGVVGTTRTIESGIYECKFALACPEMVPIIEKGEVDELAVKRVVDFVNTNDIDTLILGCTHYPLILNVFEKALPGIELVDPGLELVNSLNFVSEEGGDEYWFT